MPPQTDPADTKVLLVCSPGGHLSLMLALKGAWSDLDHTWVTLDTAESVQMLEGESVVFARGPTNRSIRALLANLLVAFRLIRRERPDAILSTGAALAFPFFLVGKVFGARLVFVESVTRTTELSLTGKLVYPLATAFFVQWPSADRRARTRYVGNVL